MNDITDAVASVFSASGALSERTGFEYRPQQGVMAAAIVSALAGRNHLIVEAPTGVGKTLAYLIPAFLYSLHENRKAVISTHTKNLQEQLVHKDIPIALSIIGADVAVATLKGRRNYLCSTRLMHAAGGTSSLFDHAGNEQLRRILEWSCLTPDGDMEALGFTPRPDVWDAVCSEPGICSSGICTQRCFFQRAKLRAREARVVILNHALFFSLLGAGANADHFLFPDDYVIFDEAHTLEGVAGSGIGIRISHRQTLQTIHKIYHPKARRGLVSARRKKVIALCSSAEAAAGEFFGAVRIAAHTLAAGTGSPGTLRQEVRIRNPHLVVDSLTGPLDKLETSVREIENDTDDMFSRQELIAARAALQSLQGGVDSFLDQSDSTLTYWVETPPGISGDVVLCAAPQDIGEVLGPRLFHDDTSVILTSATLSVNGSLDYFQQRIGAGAAAPLILDSPFDHARQMTITVARDIAEPESDAYAGELPSWIIRSIDRTHGKALVLFTSSIMMRSTAAALAHEFSARGLTLMVQGVDGQRHSLLEAFKHDIHSVLFGLDSFWMGVDVPGEALEHVIITRLPFAVPNHPLIEARLEAITAHGGNAFMEYTLPEAILKFKQGAGRLIRTREDRGFVTILDARILKKSYGRAFISSLPRCPLEIWTSEGDVELIEPMEP